MELDPFQLQLAYKVELLAAIEHSLEHGSGIGQRPPESKGSENLSNLGARYLHSDNPSCVHRTHAHDPQFGVTLGLHFLPKGDDRAGDDVDLFGFDGWRGSVMPVPPRTRFIGANHAVLLVQLLLPDVRSPRRLRLPNRIGRTRAAIRGIGVPACL